MFSAEVLSQLRSLNWLVQEIRRVPTGNRESALLQSQVEAVRARLPDSILQYHDHLAKEGKPSAAQVVGETCGGCHVKLSPSLLTTLALPGRFGVCPKCGVFLWAAASEVPTAPLDARQQKPEASDE